MTEQME